MTEHPWAAVHLVPLLQDADPFVRYCAHEALRDAAETPADGIEVILTQNDVEVPWSGQYTDDFVAQDGDWKIKHRHLDLDLPY